MSLCFDAAIFLFSYKDAVKKKKKKKNRRIQIGVTLIPKTSIDR